MGSLDSPFDSHLWLVVHYRYLCVVWCFLSSHFGGCLGKIYTFVSLCAAPIWVLTIWPVLSCTEPLTSLDLLVFDTQQNATNLFQSFPKKSQEKSKWEMSLLILPVFRCGWKICHLHRLTKTLTNNRIFYKHTKLAIIFISALETLLCENKEVQQQMLPKWALNLDSQPLGSDALLSEPLRHVLDRMSLNCLLFFHHINLRSFS